MVEVGGVEVGAVEVEVEVVDLSVGEVARGVVIGSLVLGWAEDMSWKSCEIGQWTGQRGRRIGKAFLDSVCLRPLSGCC